MTDTVHTRRLTLRVPVAGDAARIAALANDADVVRLLTSVPHPYGVEQALQFIAQVSDTGAARVIVADEIIGMVGLGSMLGYWLGKDYWGRGYAFEAAQAMTKWHFAQGGGDLASGYLDDNRASRNVLIRCGFVADGDTRVETVRGTHHDHHLMKLTRPRFEAIRDYRIETERLVLSPLTEADVPAVATLAGPHEVSRMLASIPHPFSEDDAFEWIQRRVYCGRPGFMLAIRKGDALIGCVGMGGTPVSVMYWLGQPHWGHGFATEAMRGFLKDIFARFDLEAVEAGCFTDNPVSARVLQKLGFALIGESVQRSRARVEPAPHFDYRLERTAFLAGAA
ncbi:MAG: GNAT family N-acetyltransferase [Pseudomonadota bacterium]